jgi:hypothetical protein
LNIASGSPPAQDLLQSLHTGVDNNEEENVQPSAAARLFQDEILQAAAAEQTTAVEQSTTATGQLDTPAIENMGNPAMGNMGNPAMENMGNPATSTIVTDHNMDVDVAAFRNHPPAHIVATVRYGRGHAVRGSTAREVHPANPNLLWCTKGQHWIHRDCFGDQRTCAACREKE